MPDDIRSNYLRFLDLLASCARRKSRDADSVQLVVVTKGQSILKIDQVVQAGARTLGENYPEETIKKIDGIDKKVNWHMIGHLQSRKIKYIVDAFSMIHSIDREEIALKLNAQLAEAGKRMPALFEVNLSGESSKGGFVAWDEAGWPVLADKLLPLCTLTNLQVVGLMTMPPFTENPENSRKVFKKCRKLLDYLQKKLGKPEFVDLSMGTSLDFEIAIEEGATYIRIGQAIMGKRSYTQKK